MQWTPTSTSLTVQNVMQQYLEVNQHLIKNKTVLDLACHDGISTGIIKKLGAKHIYGVEARQELLAEAKKNIKGDVDFFVGDIQDEKTISSLVEKSDTVVALGVLYHLYNHFGFLSYNNSNCSVNKITISSS